MHDHSELICCPDGECSPSGLSRRRFLTLTAGLAGLGLLADRRAMAAALGVAEDDVFVVPADKRIPAEWMRTLSARGEPTTYLGSDLTHIGMPVGGVCAGQLYLGGDGRLWRWDVFNITGRATSDAAYLDPYEPSSPFRNGFALRVGDRIRSLDADGFDDVRFTGQYPIGRVEYRSAGSPVEVALEAFSPFVPLEVDDSSLPATVLAYTLHNTSNQPVEAELLGWAENPVCLRSRSRQPTRLHSAAFGAPQVAGLEFSASLGDAGGGETRPDITFEDWERETYEGWTVEGDAFGPGPVLESEVPDYMKRSGDLNVTGTRFVTSHAFWAGDIVGADVPTGRLISRPFTIERRSVQTRVGGGSTNRTAVRVVVDGEVVASASGSDAEPMTPLVLDLARWEGRTATIEIVDAESGGWGHVNVDDIVFTDRPPDITFEDWERETYEGWTVEGDAFGPGPVLESNVPEYMRRFGDLNVTGSRFVTSHAFWAGDVGQADVPTGRLVSRPFTIERRYIRTRVGGGSWERTALRILVDGEVVASASGADAEPMTLLVLDVARWAGRTATIEIVDGESGGWGHVNVDDIVFTDSPPDLKPLSELPDAGTFALAALDPRARVRPSIASWSTLEEMATSGPGPDVVDAGLADQAGAVGVTVRIPPRQSTTVRFLVGWCFPLPDRQFLGFLRDAADLRHHYSTRFSSAQDVVREVARDRVRLEGKTRLWVKTFYGDSTLPHWFLERTLANASTLATTVCHRFQDGRFYGWEGTYCCAGTCQHVWNYAQAVGRLFPALERDTRERVDLDIAFNPATGQTGFRAEADMNWAADGQAGTILRFYREHLTATDNGFLTRNWPRLKRTVEFLIGRDAGPDGTLDGLQHNTLDANWFGEIAWISSMYVRDGHDRRRRGVRAPLPRARRLRRTDPRDHAVERRELHPQARPRPREHRQPQRRVPHRSDARPESRLADRSAPAGDAGRQVPDRARPRVPLQLHARRGGMAHHQHRVRRRPLVRDRGRARCDHDHLAERRRARGARQPGQLVGDLLQRVLVRAGVPARCPHARRRTGRAGAARDARRPRALPPAQAQPVQRDRVQRALRARDGLLRRVHDHLRLRVRRAEGSHRLRAADRRGRLRGRVHGRRRLGAVPAGAPRRLAALRARAASRIADAQVVGVRGERPCAEGTRPARASACRGPRDARARRAARDLAARPRARRRGGDAPCPRHPVMLGALNVE
jgi:hypothetical protein